MHREQGSRKGNRPRTFTETLFYLECGESLDFAECGYEPVDRCDFGSNLGMDSEKIAMNEREPVPASRAQVRNSDQPPTLITIIHECLKLADLQFQLFQMDIVEFWKRSQWALGLLALGGALLLGSLPIALMAIAAWLEATIGLTREASLACTAAMGVIIAVTTLAWAVMRLQRAIEPLASNQEELRANLQWMRHLLHQDEINDAKEQ